MPDNSHYLKRVVPEHRRPNFMKWIETNLIPVDDATNIIKELDFDFEIDNAVGIQLDVTGDIVGRKRLLNFEPSDGSSPLLEDDLYRLLQKAKISINQWDGTIPGVIELWENLFPEYQLIVEDNQNMTMNNYIVGDTSQLERELLAKGYIAPKPEGVRIHYNFILPTIELEKKLFIGSIMIADSAHITIPNKTIDNMNFENNTYIKGALVEHISKDFLKTKCIDDMVIHGNENIFVGISEVSYIFVPTAPLSL